MKEIWKTIRGFPGYKISNYGRIKSYKRGKPFIKKQTLDKNTGYYFTLLSKDGKLYNRRPGFLVLEAFVSKKPKNKVVHYKDYDKTNNRLDNLEWITQKKLIIKTIKEGKRHLLSNEQIIDRFNKNKSLGYIKYKKIRFKYKLKKTNPDVKESPRYKNIIQAIKSNNYSLKKTGKKLGLSRERIRQILTKHGYIIIKYLLINGEIKAKKVIAGKGKEKIRKTKRICWNCKKEFFIESQNLACKECVEKYGILKLGYKYRHKIKICIVCGKEYKLGGKLRCKDCIKRGRNK
jgi:hypothetical protein